MRGYVQEFIVNSTSKYIYVLWTTYWKFYANMWLHILCVSYQASVAYIIVIYKNRGCL